VTLIEAIVLGIVQGLTEFLPISSTAHLRIVPALLGWADPGAATSAIIQLGTMLAVVAFFRRDIISLSKSFTRGLVRRKPFWEFESRLAWYIAVGTIPVVVLGLLFKNFIETSARSLYLIAASLVILALILALAERISARRRDTSTITFGDSIIVGFAQALALIPGSSRSGTTITAALFLGFTREAAARFSFLLSIPAVVASGLFELFEVRHSLTGLGALNLSVATLVSAITGYAAIAFLLRYLRTHTTYVFIWYRIFIGVVIFLLVFLKIISPLS
jgi:undecaprenyl-diphosphatase